MSLPAKQICEDERLTTKLFAEPNAKVVLEPDKARCAVEVTTLTSELQLGSRGVPQVGAVDALRGFVKAIED